MDSEGLDGIDKLWINYNAREDKDGVIAREKQAATNIIMAGALRGLPCNTRDERIKKLEKSASRQAGAVAVIVVIWIIATTLLLIFLQ